MPTTKITAGHDNPFSEVMSKVTGAAEDFTKMFSTMKMPGVPDVEVLLSAYRRNMETLSAVNRIALEGAQAVAQRHMEIVQQTMAELQETMMSLAAVSEPPQAKAAKQTELLKKAYERAISNTRELGDLIQRSNTEALELLSNRFTEVLGEVKALAGQAGMGRA